MSRGIVVDHKETGIRYAVSESNFRDELHEYVRELSPGETIVAFRPRPREPQEIPGGTSTRGNSAGDSEEDLGTAEGTWPEDSVGYTQTEGSNQDTKEQVEGK